MAKKLIAVVLITGALYWIQKTLQGTPPQAAAEAAQVKTSVSVGGLKVQMPQPASDGTAAAPSSEDTKALSGLLAGLQKLVNKTAATPEGKAKQRLEALMAAWKEGGTSLNDEAQAAACLWSRGVRFIPDRDEIQDAAQGFDHFRQGKGVYVEIRDYAIIGDGNRGTHPGRGAYTAFEVMINGTPYAMGVPDTKNPIFWVN